MMTVVGLLIAGEIYIHFSNKDVQDAKMSELLKAVQKSVPQVHVPDQMGSAQSMFEPLLNCTIQIITLKAFIHPVKCLIS